MMPFSARFFYVVISGLEGFERNAAVQGVNIIGGQRLPDSEAPIDEVAHYLGFLNHVEQQCQLFDLQKIIDRINRTRTMLAKPILWSTLKNEMRVIREDILDAIKKDVFLYVDREKAKYYDQDELFGKQVSKRFKSARDDIRESGTCYALGGNTASVFHSMRVAERGLGVMARELKVPFERENWQNVIEGIESKIKAIDAWPKGLSKEQAQKFFSDAAMECRHFKNVWRNHVSHARDSYDPDVAHSVLIHVEAFMQKLATRLAE
jgi:hypothetical protein